MENTKNGSGLSKLLSFFKSGKKSRKEIESALIQIQDLDSEEAKKLTGDLRKRLQNKEYLSEDDVRLSTVQNSVKFIHEFAKKHFMNEKLTLRRKDDKIYVISDDPQDSSKSFKEKETVRNKEKLKKAGFRFDGIAWYVYSNKLGDAQKTIETLNNSPLEKFLDKFDDLPEFIEANGDFDKKTELVKKLDGFLDSLASEVDAVKSSEELRNYLEFNAKFRGYSAYNTMLIWLQNRNATKVAGFNAWKKLHRFVKKGAKGITIFAPRIKKVEDDSDDTGLDGAVKTRNVTRFIPVTVFDVSDTEAVDERGNIPTAPNWHDDNTPNELADRLFESAKKLADELGVKVTSDAAKGGEQGFASATGDHINISSGVQGVGAISTMIHEIAHNLIHFKETSPFYIGDEMKLTKEAKEWQAESISYVVLKHYGLPVQHHATYMALWKANKEVLREHMSIIRNVSEFIIKSLDKYSTPQSNDTTPAT
jgi:hypothetical protein